MDKNYLRKFKTAFKKARNIVIVTHINPDGDALGSMLGFGIAAAIWWGYFETVSSTSLSRERVGASEGIDSSASLEKVGVQAASQAQIDRMKAVTGGIMIGTGLQDRLGAVADAELLHDRADVCFDGGFGHAQFGGDLFVEQPGGQHREDAKLLRSERGQSRCGFRFAVVERQ